MPEYSIQRAEVRNGFEWSHYGSSADITGQFDAGLLHSLAAQSADPHFAEFAGQSPRHFGTVHVAGRFTGNDQKAVTHGTCFVIVRNWGSPVLRSMESVQKNVCPPICPYATTL